MSWINRFRARTGSAVLCAFALAAGYAQAAQSSQSYSVTYQGHTVVFSHIIEQPEGPALGVEDPALGALLASMNAALTWHPGAHDVVITTAQPKLISFTVGDRHYDVGATSTQGRFAPFLRGDEVYLSLDDLLQALSLAPATVVSGSSTNRYSSTPLPTPTTTPTLPASPTPLPTPVPFPTPTIPQPYASSTLAHVTSVQTIPTENGITIQVNVNGGASFEWHRLPPPDNRFWIDIIGARLDPPPSVASLSGILTSLRVAQNDPTTVRIALSLSGMYSLDVIPSETQLQIIVSNQLIAEAPRMGTGTVGIGAPISPTPQPTRTPLIYMPTNPKLIVIDPGHGGSDPGVIYNGVMEKTLNLDMAKRLRDILVARGWDVRMTRTGDTDVFAPFASNHDELQTRVDVANRAGARIFVSIHVNGFINPGPSGTTTYYSKAEDEPLAQDIERAVVTALGTKDDGIIKAHMYVTLHTSMPAVLIETAFISNPNDFTRLTSPQWREQMAQAIASGIEEYLR